MRIDQAVNIEDLHRMAKRRLPKIAFDFIEGGLEDERGLETNTSAFHKHKLLPRYLVDVSKRDQTKTIFGQTFSSPFGISPTGGAGLFRHHADLMLAEAARDANIPYIMSGASNDTIEEAAKIAPNNHWYQLYAARDHAVNADLIALPSTSSVPYAAAVSNRLTPSSIACRMIAIASASLLPCASPSWLNPPQPSPATPTRNPVLPSVVYSIIHLSSVSAASRCKSCTAQPRSAGDCRIVQKYAMLPTRTLPRVEEITRA